MRESPGAQLIGSPSWLSWCCIPLTFHSQPQNHIQEKMHAAVIADQPEPQARLIFGRSSTESSLRLARTTSTSKVQSPKLGFFGRQRNHSDASSRKMLISAPTHFRHLTSGSQHAFPARPLDMHPPEARRTSPAHELPRIPQPSVPARDWELESRRESLPPLEPLELNIYTRRSRLSPLLPQFELPYMMQPSPPPAYAREEAERSHVLRSQRSMPSLSRAPSRSPGVSDGNSTESLTYTITTSRQTARSRSHTSPDVEAIRNRVANAMQEVERLQKKIDDVVERHSMYTPSRPSSAHSAHSIARTLHDLEPMPSIPALPPSAPSFAERLHCEADGLPTVPSVARPSYTTGEEGRQGAGSRQPKSPPVLQCDDIAKTMPPPLPLVLRPPLRKKKPFRESLSGFVFPLPPQKGSLDSVTNKPRPIKETDGFYQCVPVNGAHISYESLHSLSSSNDGENGEGGGARSPYSPATPRGLPIERCATFGKNDKGLPLSVGIAL